MGCPADNLQWENHIHRHCQHHREKHEEMCVSVSTPHARGLTLDPMHGASSLFWKNAEEEECHAFGRLLTTPSCPQGACINTRSSVPIGAQQRLQPTPHKMMVFSHNKRGIFLNNLYQTKPLSARAQRKPATAPRREEHHGARQGAGPRGPEGGRQRHDDTHRQRCHVHLQCLLGELPSLLFSRAHPQASSAASAEAVYHVESRILLTRVCARINIINRAPSISRAVLRPILCGVGQTHRYIYLSAYLSAFYLPSSTRQEDPRIDHTVLKCNKDDHVITIASAGEEIAQLLLYDYQQRCWDCSPCWSFLSGLRWQT